MTLESTSVSTTSTGSANAAELRLDYMLPEVDVHYNVSGSATVTIEVSNDGTNWFTFDTISESASAEDIVQLSTVFRKIRAHADANLTRIEIAGRGDD